MRAVRFARTTKRRSPPRPARLDTCVVCKKSIAEPIRDMAKIVVVRGRERAVCRTCAE